MVMMFIIRLTGVSAAAEKEFPMPETTIIKLTAPTLTGLTAATARTESQLNGLTTATIAATASAPLTLNTALATHLTAAINSADYDGLIAEARQLPANGNAVRYQFVLRPWLWWLTLANNNRVFQNLSAQEIVEKVFKDADLATTHSSSKPNRRSANTVCNITKATSILSHGCWSRRGSSGSSPIKKASTLVLADDNSAFPAISGGKK
jgi:type VI secretion system secreted protein VgrG